ncbi:MAG: Gldg family protein [Christensenellales bacterium]
MKWSIKNIMNKNDAVKDIKSEKKQSSSDQNSKDRRSLKDSFQSNVKAFKSKRFKAAGYSTVLIVFAIIIVIMVNLVVSSLPAQYIKFDVSNQQLYTISEQTEKVLKDLKQDVTMYLVAETNTKDSYINELMTRYAGLSSHIKVVTIDPVVEPTFVKTYTEEELSNNSVIIVSDNRNRVLDYNEIIVATYDQSSYYYTAPQPSDYYFYGEQLFTSGISFVTSENLPTLYSLQGHGESELSDTMKKLIGLDNIEIKTISLISMEKVPEDADCLLIYAPVSDLSKEDKDKILSYLEGGGDLLLFSNYDVVAMPNLIELMQNYGVAPKEGIALESDANYYVQYPHYLVPKIESHTVTEPLIKNNYYVLLTAAHTIHKLESYRDTLTITSLLTTSDSSYLKIPVDDKLATFEKEQGDSAGPFNLGVAVTESFNNIKTNVVWFSSGTMLNDDINEAVAGGNSDLVLNVLGWMTEREETVAIRSKSMLPAALSITEADSQTWTILFCVAIPGAVLITGGVIWFNRRKR